MQSVNTILEKIFPADFKRYLSHRFPDWHYSVRKGEVRVRIWLKELLSETIRLTLLTVIVCLGYIAGLYFLQGSWHLFADTFLGRQYIEKVDAARAAEIFWVLSLDFKSLGGTISLTTVLVSGLVGMLSQLTLLRRFFYVGRSSLVKLCWVALVCAMVARQFAKYYPMDFSLAFGLCLLPTLAIFSPVLAAAGKLLPELNLQLYLENYRERRDIQNLKDDIARLMEGGADEDFD